MTGQGCGQQRSQQSSFSGQHDLDRESQTPAAGDADPDNMAAFDLGSADDTPPVTMPDDDDEEAGNLEMDYARQKSPSQTSQRRQLKTRQKSKLRNPHWQRRFSQQQHLRDRRHRESVLEGIGRTLFKEPRAAPRSVKQARARSNRCRLRLYQDANDRRLPEDHLAGIRTWMRGRRTG